MIKISKILILGIFSLYLFSATLEVNASQSSTVQVTGYLDKDLESNTHESFEDNSKDNSKEEKQTILSKGNLPKTGEASTSSFLVLGFIFTISSILLFLIKRKKTT
ncbi:LPXTG cell wall anchor domain-containing protein [Enterococcus thailandicus]|uniref:LPXTG cell wall anchor domain-containing protein n=1 Tax=Enterococcus thailandicus TaxID=417368 RepID=UPI0022EBD690|nr:LPXTG cell wall anchor domain-containing protein [Enterococcus thailandicus]MDA3973010.1 LPXTG cell wall anchor domain-containing protein [Enterococcus thailandicus]MDA3975556.1 LPXTG cell wall anchor domain-containing protein [Enterococcus thailandicus]MDA3980470.1 LPXTG cell wall anchor domain-containing protein [Enterococcus thailandicus]